MLQAAYPKDGVPILLENPIPVRLGYVKIKVRGGKAFQGDFQRPNALLFGALIFGSIGSG